MPKTSKLNNKNKSNDIVDFKPSFPPKLTIDDLINNHKRKSLRLPNAFIVYRMALIKEYRNRNRKLPPMGELSKIAKNYWNMEPKNIKDFYASLVKDAKNYMEHHNQMAVENLQTQGSAVSAEKSSQNNDVSSLYVSSTEIPLFDSSNYDIDTSYDLSSIRSILNDREYIKVLEQIIDHYLP